MNGGIPCERQRADGRYDYRYIDQRTGKRVTIYSTDLAELREMEKKVQREVDDGLITTSDMKKLDVNTLFENYLSLRELVDSTRVNYIRMWELHVKDDIIRKNPAKDALRDYGADAKEKTALSVEQLYDVEN